MFSGLQKKTIGMKQINSSLINSDLQNTTHLVSLSIICITEIEYQLIPDLEMSDLASYSSDSEAIFRRCFPK